MRPDDLARKDEAFAARIVNASDPEQNQRDADDVLIEALRAAGFNKTADAWEAHSVDWWWG